MDKPSTDLEASDTRREIVEFTNNVIRMGNPVPNRLVSPGEAVLPILTAWWEGGSSPFDPRGPVANISLANVQSGMKHYAEQLYARPTIFLIPLSWFTSSPTFDLIRIHGGGLVSSRSLGI